MTRLNRIWQHWCCTHGRTHQRNWAGNDPTHCRYCTTLMPLDGRTYVGLTNPSAGD